MNPPPPSRCKFPGCQYPAIAKTFCLMHESEWIASGEHARIAEDREIITSLEPSGNLDDGLPTQFRVAPQNEARHQVAVGDFIRRTEAELRNRIETLKK